MFRVAAVLSAAFLAACSSGGPRLAPPVPVTADVESGGDVSLAADWNELDKVSGLRVTAQGTFGQVGGKHGTLTLDSGLVILLPHFDLFRRGDDWFRYVGRRVAVEGVLHTYATQVPGVTGPSIIPETFTPQD